MQALGVGGHLLGVGSESPFVGHLGPRFQGARFQLHLCFPYFSEPSLDVPWDCLVGLDQVEEVILAFLKLLDLYLQVREFLLNLLCGHCLTLGDDLNELVHILGCENFAEHVVDHCGVQMVRPGIGGLTGVVYLGTPLAAVVVGAFSACGGHLAVAFVAEDQAAEKVTAGDLFGMPDLGCVGRHYLLDPVVFLQGYDFHFGCWYQQFRPVKF